MSYIEKNKVIEEILNDPNPSKALEELLLKYPNLDELEIYRHQLAISLNETREQVMKHYDYNLNENKEVIYNVVLETLREHLMKQGRLQ